MANYTIQTPALFNRLEERWAQQMNDIYGKYSTKDLPDGQRGNEPYLESKPNKPTQWNFGGPRSSEMDAIKADAERMTKFVGDNPVWILDQQNLQTGNTFSETRVINPLFALLAPTTQPYVHIKRSLGDTVNNPLTGGAHPGSPTNVGAAGRLQKSTSKYVVNLLKTGTNATIWDTLARIVPPNRITNTINMVANTMSAITGDGGSLSVMQRPELDWNGTGRFDTLYSIELWKKQALDIHGYDGQLRVDTPANTLAQVGNALRTGNIQAARTALTTTVSQATQGARTVINGVGNFFRTAGGTRGARARGDESGNAAGGQNSPRTQDNQRATDRLAGKRYFISKITGDNNDRDVAERYLEGTINFPPGEYPRPHLNIGYEFPTMYSEPIVTVTPATELNADLLAIQSPSPAPARSENARQRGRARGARAVADTRTRNQTHAQTSQAQIARGTTAALNIIQAQTNAVLGRSVASTDIVSWQALRMNSSENPGRELMRFGGLSLQSRWENVNESTDPSAGRMREINAALDTQQTNWLHTIEIIGYKGAGYKGGIPINGQKVEINPNAKNPFSDVQTDSVTGVRSYFYDPINSYPVVSTGRQESSLTKEIIDQMKATHGTPLVDLYFFDFVNKVAVPFRANITSMNESVSPEFTDNFYIGRTERNIVYTGVRRELSLSFIIHAFNEVELSGIWAKLNYLTSLCFPSRYTNGFMVPPLTKLTLGDVYNNQPGYIKSINYVVDPDTPWEISEPMQVPHGITVSLGFSIIEKVAQESRKYIGYDPLHPERDFVPLYNYGNPRLRQPPPRPPRRRGRRAVAQTAPRCAVPVTGTRNGITIAERRYNATRDNAGPPSPRRPRRP